MEENYKEFILSFFDKLGCDVAFYEGVYCVTNVPRSFSDFVTYEEPYRICFDKKRKDCEFVSSISEIGRAVTRFLDNAGKTTLLKIEFDVDPLVEIKKRITLKNCEIENLTKREKNSFFSRFSFLSTFRYLNEREQVLNEVYVHDGKIVGGDLIGYKKREGEEKKVDLKFLKNDFEVAKNSLKDLLGEKIETLSKVVGEKLEKETMRIEEYYDKQLKEMSVDLNNRLEKIKILELEMRGSGGEEKEELKGRIERLRRGLLKMAGDDVATRVLKEKEFSLRDTKEKFSLNISNKLLNTTVIYYPVFSFDLYLKSDKSKKYIELIYDPLIKDFLDFNCDECGVKINEVLLCCNGHIVCKSCLTRCSECGDGYCKGCLEKKCSCCDKNLCKNCIKVCRGCSKYVCLSHLREDCVSGEERCINCLRACSRCHGVSSDKYFGVAKDGSKICEKCLGEERRKKVLEGVFG